MKINPFDQTNAEEKDDDNPSSVDVSADSKLTPISKTKIPVVDADRWNEMSPSELFDQLFTLEQRLFACQQYGQIEAAKQIQKGITSLKAAIDRAGGNEVKLL